MNIGWRELPRDARLNFLRSTGIVTSAELNNLFVNCLLKNRLSSKHLLSIGLTQW
jgi:hypothetical protein